MAMTICQLGGYTYPFNPVENRNPGVRAVSVQDTLGGRLYTDWGQQASRREIVQTWPTLPAAFFEALDAKAALGGTLSYRHDDNVMYTVIAQRPTYQRKTPGGDGYMGVSFVLHVVSQP